ncbi:ParA family protein [Acinetobacter baumannii]|uniref:ParA family protein n=1 Tax=Acinetobacter baumannii TaxID=470 RepID=UPI000DF30C9B|nr:ParA family protein [Acinetobacter baumannii]RCT89703.1 ParA family protein [Acinetobacter baumannii]
MKIIVVANQKGGVGKSIISIHLAYFFKELGYVVNVVDLDPQGNTSSILSNEFQNFKASELFTQEIGTLNQNDRIFVGDIGLSNCQDNIDISLFRKNMSQLASLPTENQKTICIIDTAPTASTIQIAPLVVADFVVSPIEIDEFSFSGIKNISSTINNVKNQYNPKLNFLGIIPNRVHGTSPRQKQLLAQLQANYGHLLLSKEISLGERQAVRDAIGKRQPVWKLKSKSKAKNEFLDMVKLVAEKVN